MATHTSSGAASTATPSGTAPRPGRWPALGVVALAQLLTALDATVVNIALPTAQADLGFSDADRQWVVTAYTLTFAGLLLIGGRLGDRIGRTRAFAAGLVTFAAASALAGSAPSFEVLLAGRALQGAGAAVVAPTALSLVVVLFRDPQERGRAFAVYGAVASSGAVIGLLLGGTLTELASWRWSLYAGVVLALVALAGAARLLPRLPGDGSATIQVGSAVLATAGLGAVVLAASGAAAGGWAHARVVVPLVSGSVLLAGFTALQRRLAVPMLPLHLFTDRRRVAAYVAVAVSVVGSLGLSLMLTYHFQRVLGWEPLVTGLAFLPLSLAVAASGYLVSGVLSNRVAARWLVATGLLLAGSGLALVATLSPGSGYPTTILPALLLVGAGMGGVFTPSIGVVVSGVEPQDSGIASAMANTAMQVGGSLGVAVLNTVAVTATRGFAAGSGTAAAVHGFAVASGTAAAALVAAAGVVLLLMRDHRDDGPR